jgi:hypothetical protein
MWESSGYFEDFDNAANYVNGRFDPKAAQARRAEQAQRLQAQAQMQGEVRTIAQRHRPRQQQGQG